MPSQSTFASAEGSVGNRISAARVTRAQEAGRNAVAVFNGTSSKDSLLYSFSKAELIVCCLVVAAELNFFEVCAVFYIHFSSKGTQMKCK